MLRTDVFERLFSEVVRNDERYHGSLDALGVAANWAAYLQEQLLTLERTLTGTVQAGA